VAIKCDAALSVKEDVPKDILASAIVKMSEAVEALQTSGLNERAICALVKDYCGIPKDTTQTVLRSLRELRARYTTR